MHAICTNNVKVNIMVSCYKINLKQEKYYNHFSHIREDEVFIEKKKQYIANILMWSNVL